MVPSHMEQAYSRDEFVAQISNEIGVDHGTAEKLADFSIIILGLFDLRRPASREFIQTADQMQTYCRNSLVWYLKNDMSIVSNWSRSGVASELDIKSLLDNAPYFLRLMEEKRVHLSAKSGIDPENSRLQAVSVCLVKMNIRGKAHILHQWDERAAQFQIIGGRSRIGETPEDTAARELNEEIVEHALIKGRDFEISALNPSAPIVYKEISRTYGALTRYEISLFHVSFNIPKLRLSENDRWISVNEMRAGVTKTGKTIVDYHRVADFERAMGMRIEDLPNSVSRSQHRNVLEYVEFKPGIFGFHLDVKRILAEFFALLARLLGFAE
jgi:hypothetical protein